MDANRHAVLCHNAGMPKSNCLAVASEPGFHGQVMLLPLSDDPDWPAAPTLEIDGATLVRKSEFHVTLLDRALATTLRARLGDARIAALAADFDWRPQRSGEGSVLRKTKTDAGAPLPCASLIERVALPAFAAFRRALAAASGLPVPEALPHVTLYVAGDPAGIGLPDLAAFAATRQFDLPVPGTFASSPPTLTAALRAAYASADYRIAQPPMDVRVGRRCAALDAEFTRLPARRGIVITACNPFSTPLSPAANALRQQWLQFELASAGIATAAAENRDPAGRWPAEPSLLAFDTLPELDDRLLQRHRQHALLAIDCGRPARLVLHPWHRAQEPSRAPTEPPVP